MLTLLVVQPFLRVQTLKDRDSLLRCPSEGKLAGEVPWVLADRNLVVWLTLETVVCLKLFLFPEVLDNVTGLFWCQLSILLVMNYIKSRLETNKCHFD